MKMLKDPYACNFCDQSFSVSKALVAHVKIKHAKINYPQNETVENILEEQKKVKDLISRQENIEAEKDAIHLNSESIEQKIEETKTMESGTVSIPLEIALK